MGLLKRNDRSAAQGPVRKSDRPLPPGAAIARRPVNPVENTLLDVFSGGSRGRAIGGRSANRADGSVRVPTYLPTYPAVEDSAPAGERGSSSQETASGQARPGAVTPDSESAAFALHLGAEPTLERLIAPVPDTPDPKPEQARIERELGIEALASSLKEYGTPPMAPMAKPTDRDALECELLDAALADMSPWKVSARRLLRKQAREQASREAQAEDERLGVEREQLQHELDARWAELRELRDRAASEVSEWVDEERQRRKSARAEQQAVLDREWQRLIDADPDSVTATLRAAFPDGSTTVLGSLDGVAVLVITCPHVDEVIAETEPAVTSAGRRILRARPASRRNDLYLSAIASRVLAAAGRALSTTPAVEAVACVVVRARESSDRPWESIYVGTFERAYAERLLVEGRWSADPEALAKAVVEADDVDLELTGRTREIVALDLSVDPGLMAVIDQLDPAIRSDEEAARTSDQAAVKAFLNYVDKERDMDSENGGEELANLQGDLDKAAHEPPSEVEPTPDQSMQRRSPDGLTPRQDDAAARPGGSGSMQDALKDADGFVRRAAVEAIGRRDDPNDTPLLLEALRDPDENVRLEAMYALRDRLSPDLRRDALIRACSDTDEVMRRKAIEALAELGDERDTPLLQQALKDGDDNVRLEAIYALKSRFAPDMRDALIETCSDVDERVRRKAFQALAELGDERDTPLLLKALTDSDSSVRLEAIYALEGRSMLGSSSRFSGPLSEAIKDENASVRRVAVRLLGRLEQPTTARRST